MKISYSWLRAYLELDLPPQKLGDILTNIGLEVEGIETCESVKGGLEGVLVGEVLTCDKHPGADRLFVTTVDVGQASPLRIVCGAPNVRAGQKVPVATVGSILHRAGEKLEIKKSKIRGELSEGMICAEDELGLGSSHDGILVLDPEAVVGTPASTYFRIEPDTVFEIDLTPNRIDASSHLGVARDLAAYLGKNRTVRVNRPSVDQFSVDNRELPIPVEVVDPQACIRYSGITLKGVDVKESPRWLQHRLRSIGLEPINNVVDITNFVLHECGQPLHAFDAAHIKGHKVIVRTMPGGTRFVTLDGQERELLGSDLMICNAEEGMCIAGVFGGIRSGVTGSTREIFLESACFDPVTIRRTSKHHGLSTDASFRFERGTDPNLTVWALKRAAMMIREIAGGTISSEVVDVYPRPVEDFRVEISFAHVNRLLGNHIDPVTMRSILASLEIGVESETENGMILRVPPYRVDVRREADVIEEILRIYGFNRIEPVPGLRSTLSHPAKPDRELVINTASDLLTSSGFFEIKSNSLTRSAYYDRGEERDPAAVRLFNPLSQDLSVMRRNLLFGGLEAIAYNINRRATDLKLYEFGYIYSRDPQQGNRGRQDGDLLSGFREQLQLGIFLTGKWQPGNWAVPSADSSFYVLKNYLETVLLKLGIRTDSLDAAGSGNPHFAEGMVYATGGNRVVEFGIVAPGLLKEFDIKQPVFAGEFNWDQVLQLIAGHRIQFAPLPKFQVVNRDFSLMLDRQITYESIRELAFRTEGKLLRKVSLFDVYEGDKIEKGKKSYALTFTLLDESRTLTDKQIDKTMLNLARAFEKEFGAVVRGMK